MSKHTPGPWTFRPFRVSRGWTSEYVIDGPSWKEMCLVYVQDEDRLGTPMLGCGAANAALIAAAPDLLAACELVEADSRDPQFQMAGCLPSETYDAVRAAIAKAKR